MISEGENLRRREANYRPLTPMHFLLRSADVFPAHVAVIDGARSFTWRQYADRCLRLASALRKRGIGKGDTVAVLAPNTSAVLEAHFGIPMAGAVICALNVRLDASTLAFILGHSEARMLLANRQFADLARQAVAMTKISLEVIGIDDPEAPEGEIADWTEYESFLETGDAADSIVWPDDEWDSIALNYTSGTTGNPKGAVYHHRGTYLNSLGQLPDVRHRQRPGLFVDPADVPLQRLVLRMGHRRCRRHTCLSAQGGGRYHLRCHIPARRDAHVLRPDGSEFRGRRR